MKYSSLIDNIAARAWGLNIQQAYLFEWLYSLPSWATPAIIEGGEYFFASKTKAIEELPLLTDKVDTMYRYYRQLEEIGLIHLKKVDGKDYVRLTEKAKVWGRVSGDPEKNPDQFGKKSGKRPEKNPTYKTTIHDKITRDKDVAKATPETEEFTDEINFIDNPLGKNSSQKPLELEHIIKPASVYAQCVDIWLKKIHPDWTFGGAQGKAIKSIIKKIETVIRAAGSADSGPTDATVVAFFEAFCLNMPEWFRNKDLQIIDQKFNEIMTQIQQGGKKKDDFHSRNSSERLFSKYSQ